MQVTVDELKAKLNLPYPEDSGQAKTGGEHDTLRRLEAMRIEVHSEYRRTSTLLKYLMALSRRELERAILTAVPDAQLAELLGHRATMQQKLGELNETNGPEHPEVKRTVK